MAYLVFFFWFSLSSGKPGRCDSGGHSPLCHSRPSTHFPLTDSVVQVTFTPDNLFPPFSWSQPPFFPVGVASISFFFHYVIARYALPLRQI